MKDAPAHAKNVSLSKLFSVFFYIGAISFGGGVIAYLRDHLVFRQSGSTKITSWPLSRLGKPPPD